MSSLAPKKLLQLGDFDISERTGFLPPDPPLVRLPEYFSSWEDVCARIPELIKNKRIREEIGRLPEKQFNHETLSSEREWRRAYVLISFLAQAYIWVEGEAGIVDRLPSKLAVPWCAVAQHVSLKPVLTYSSGALYNYKLHDPNGGMNAENLKAISTFTGTEDESWFYMVAAAVELAALPGLKAIEHAYKAMSCQQDALLVEDFTVITKSIRDMITTLNKMYERCSPLTFYLHVRPFQSGSKGIKAFPNGIIYEGVDTKPKLYHGASAGQSTSVPSFDVFLRAKHTGPEQEFLQTMREYMPKKHREFLETLEQLPSVREYVLHSNNPDLVGKYNSAVEAFSEFRSQHVVLVTRYIVNQRQHSVNTSLDMTGTGGTPFMKFLKQVKEDTIALKIAT